MKPGCTVVKFGELEDTGVREDWKEQCRKAGVLFCVNIF